eukprot:SAG22_NODE_2318_length_2727_cov_1.547184_2_plen_599_part_01
MGRGGSDGGGGSKLCSAARVALAVAQVDQVTREQVRLEAAAVQAEFATAFARREEHDVRRYNCTDPDTGVKENVSFPSWCAAQRQEQLSLRQRCCTDYTTQIPNQCHYSSSALGINVGATQVCFSDFPEWQEDLTVSGQEQAGCENYAIPCPSDGQAGLAVEQAALTDYLLDQAQRAIRSPEFEEKYEELQDDISDWVSSAVRNFKQRLDAASDLYILYCILRLWWPSPLLICRTPATTAVKRTVFGLSKQAFVVAVLAVWLAYDAWVYIKGVFDADLTLYLANIAADPCYLDGDFISMRAGRIAAVCAEARNMSRAVATANATMTDLYADIVAFGPATLPDGCGCEYPGNRPLVDAYMQDNETGLRPFVGNLSFCTDAEAQQRLLNPPATSVSWYTAWFKSGIVARLLLKVTLVNLAYAILGYTDPLAYVGGKYEVHHHSGPLPTEAQEEVAALLGYQHLRDALGWGLVAAIAIINLAWPRGGDSADSDGGGDECGGAAAEIEGMWLALLFLGLWVAVVGAAWLSGKWLQRLTAEVDKINPVIEALRPPPPLPPGRRRLQRVVRQHFKVNQAAGGGGALELEEPPVPAVTALEPGESF